MTTDELMSRCPYQEGTASRKLFAAMARTCDKALTAAEISRASHVAAEKTRTLLVAYRNPFHCSSLTRAGVRLVLEDGKYRLELREPDLNAHRPPPKKSRGKKKGRQKK